MLVICFCCSFAAAEGPKREPTFDPSLFADLPKKQIAMLEEFFRAYWELKTFYQNATISAREEVFEPRKSADNLPIPAAPSPSRDVVLTYIEDWQYRSREGHYFRLDGKGLDLKDRTTVVGAHTGIIRPEESFLFGYDTRTQKYYLKAHGKNREEYLGILYSYVFPVAPFSFQGQLLEYLIFSQPPDGLERSVSSVQLSEGSEDAIVTVVLRSTSVRGSSVTNLQLLRHQHWAVKRIEYNSKEKRRKGAGEWVLRILQQCDYERNIDGFPVLKRVVCESRSGDAQDPELTPRRRRVIDILDLTAGPSDVSVFDVQRLIPKFDRVGQKTSPGLVRWILTINGLILLIVGILLSRRGRRRKPTG